MQHFPPNEWLPFMEMVLFQNPLWDLAVLSSCLNCQVQPSCHSHQPVYSQTQVSTTPITVDHCTHVGLISLKSLYMLVTWCYLKYLLLSDCSFTTETTWGNQAQIALDSCSNSLIATQLIEKPTPCRLQKHTAFFLWLVCICGALSNFIVWDGNSRSQPRLDYWPAVMICSYLDFEVTLLNTVCLHFSLWPWGCSQGHESKPVWVWLVLFCLLRTFQEWLSWSD